MAAKTVVDDSDAHSQAVRAQDVRALLARAEARGASVPASLSLKAGDVTGFIQVDRSDLCALVDAANPTVSTPADEALRRVIAGSPADLRRFQAQELRKRAAQLLSDAVALETEAAALDAPVAIETMTAWDGRPTDPTRDGPHWLRNGDGVEFVAHWVAAEQMWIEAFNDDTYVEPVLTPAEVADLRSAQMLAAAQQPVEPGGELTGTEYFLQAIGGAHKPAKLGKYEGSHPTTIRRVYEEALTRQPEAADVIAALVFWRQLDRNREAFLKEAATNAE